MDFSRLSEKTIFLWLLAPLLGWAVGWLVEYVLLSKAAKGGLLQRTLKGLGRWIGLVAGAGVALRYGVLPQHWHDEAAIGWRIAMVLIVTIFLAHLIGQYFEDQTAELRRQTSTASLVQTVLQVVVYIIGLLVVLQMLGIAITPMLTALGVGGLAVALALQDTLSNLFAGIQIIASRKIRPGDFIRLSDGTEEGYVTDITWHYTSVRMLSNQVVIIPNARLANAIVTNTSLPTEEITARLDVGVHYDSDLEHVERVCVETTQTVLREYYKDHSTDFNVRVRYRAFSDSSIVLSILFPVPSFPDQIYVIHLLIKALHRRFAQEHILIPFPIRTLELKSDDVKRLWEGE
ncbi:MAG: mechanosensitive ion channel family protein [Saprospiraceae bacterium]|nr:mechanosensitive ion channel family protein [Saprospiraceae bacterium]MDW8485229.1 mechanosensitive ion channel family protein [Saprospiraceae bacterium]